MSNQLDSFSSALLDAGRPRQKEHSIKGAIAPKFGKAKGAKAKAKIKAGKHAAVHGTKKPKGFGVK